MIPWLKRLHAQQLEWVLDATGVTALLLAVGIPALIIGSILGSNSIAAPFLWVAAAGLAGAIVDMFVTTIYNRFLRKDR